MVDLLQTKWKSFIKREFYRQIMTFFVYFCISMFVFTVRPATPAVQCLPNINGTTNSTLAATLTTSALDAFDIDDGSSIEERLTTLMLDQDYVVTPSTLDTEGERG